jgi:hypothetical protein
MRGSLNRRRLLHGVITSAITATLAASVAVAWANRGPEQYPTVDPRWEPTAADRALLIDAQEVLIGRCMAERGFKYIVQRSDVETLKERDFDYVIDDVTWVRRHGYGTLNPKTVEKVRAADPVKRYAEKLNSADFAAYQTALLGARPEGLEVDLPNGHRRTMSDSSCIAKAEEGLYGDLELWFRTDRIVKNLPASYRDRVVADPRYRSATVRWAACMRAAKYTYRSPLQIREELPDLITKWSPATARKSEVRLASAEAKCAVKTRLGAVAREVDREYRGPAHQQYQNYIDGRKAMQFAALERARRIVLEQK